MFISKKIKWCCLINPYKQLCKSDRPHNLHHAYTFKYNFNSYYCICCFNMRTKSSNKLLRKKSKLKMASFSDRSSKISTHSKRSKDVASQEQWETIIDVSDIPLPLPSLSDIPLPPVSDIPLPPPRSTTCSSCGNREGKKSKESIKSEIKINTGQVNCSENSTINGQRIDTKIVTVPAPIQSLISTINEQRIAPIATVASATPSLITNCGLFNTSSSYCYNPFAIRNLGNPIYFQYDPLFQLNYYYNRNFMCRSGSTTSGDGSNTTDAVRDRELLWEWRTWHRTQYGKNFDKREDKHSAFTFTIMSYNILAQDLLSNHSYLYKHHNPNALQWEQRWKNVLFEIKQHNADILCFQEVQATHVATYYNQLKTLGYDGIYKQRTGNITFDGCAIYYKSSTFNLINYTTVEYNQPNIFVLNRDNVAIIAKFAPKQNLENEFVVATTHLLYNPRREDVRLAQVQVLLTEVDRISYTSKNKRPYHLPIIITGDFNFIPNSPVYKLITKGVLKYEHLTSRSLLHTNSNSSSVNVTGKHFLPASLGITDQCQHVELVYKRNKDKVIDEYEHIYLYHSERSTSYNNSRVYDGALFSTGVISHHLAMKSAFEHRRGNKVEATTFQNKWITVDYIFYSGVKDSNGLILEHKLNLLSRYTIPTSEQLQGVTIPNMAVGSDHFSLIAKFKLNP